MKQLNVKKLVLLNLPYFLLGLFATNLGEAWRLATGADASAKMLSFFSTLPVALGSWWPSLHPLDLAVGLCCGAGLRLAVYLKGKNAKKYRHNVEYGSARWGTHEDIAPYIDPVFQNNVILTQTERLTMSSRPRRQRFRQDPLLAEAEFDADAQLLCGHRSQGHHPGGVRQNAPAGCAQAGQGRQAGEGQTRQNRV